MRSKSRARTPISSRPPSSVRARAVALAEAVGDGADAVEPAHDGAAEQQADEARRARARRRGRAARAIGAVRGAGAVERAQVVVQLEHRVGPGRPGSGSRRGAPAAESHVAVALRADVDRRGMAGRAVARLRDLRGAVDVVPRDRDLDRGAGCGSCRAADALLHQLRVGEVADVEAVLPRRSRSRSARCGRRARRRRRRVGRHAASSRAASRARRPARARRSRGRRPVRGFKRRTPSIRRNGDGN